MKAVRILALGRCRLGLPRWRHGADPRSQTDADQPATAQSEDNTAPATDQQSTTETEQSTPAPEANSDYSD